ncbi:hypothetical protein CR513_54370, partial [Mucuna pruriens]
MAQFLHDLKREMQDVMELQHYRNLSELVHQAIKIEMQLWRRRASRKISGWKGKEKRKDRASREKSSKKRSKASIGQKELTPFSTPMRPKASSINCFQCLRNVHIASQCTNRSFMIVKDDGNIRSESSIEEVSTSNEFKNLSDGSHYGGTCLWLGDL